MRARYIECYIISGEVAGKEDAINANRTESLRSSLRNHNLKYRELLGYYKGVGEVCFLIECGLDEALAIGRVYSQEAILYRNSDNIAFLIDVETLESTNLGQFNQVPEEVAITLDNYTHDPAKGVFYAAVN